MTLLRAAGANVLRATSSLLARQAVPLLRRRPQRGRVAVLLPPAAPGSLGDLALVGALVDGISSGFETVVMLEYGQASWTVEIQKPHVRLVKGPLVPALGGPLRTANAVAGASHFFAIGADMLDGYYSVRDSLQKLQIIALASRLGCRTSVLSFSFNECPTATVVKAWHRVPTDVQLFARDEYSRDRLELTLGRPVNLAPDLAFLIGQERPWGAPTLTYRQRLLVLVPSALPTLRFGLSVDALRERFTSVLCTLLQHHSDLSIALVGHDRRGSPNDFDLADAIATQVSDDRVTSCRWVQKPEHVRWLCSQATATISFRMHAAIASLGEGTPVLVGDYQGKAPGLMRHFGLEEWAVNAQRLVLDHRYFLNMSDNLLRAAPSLASRVRAQTSPIKALARSAIAAAMGESS